MADRHAERVEAEHRRLVEIAARAEAQHHWTPQRDERELYGEYPPAAM